MSLARAAALAFLAFGAPAQAAPTVCAIRWDAWYTNNPRDPGGYTSRALAKPEWRARTPAHAKIGDDGAIVFAPTQASFDAEIRAAKQADLCWAYLAYGRDGKIDLDNPMMRGLALHRSSAIRRQVPYALIVQPRMLGHAGAYDDAVEATLALMRDENYQKVQIGRVRRPLVMYFHDEKDLAASFKGSLKDLRGPFDRLRARARQEGLGDPYVVVLAWSGPQAEAIRKTLGADAVSRYTIGTRKTGAEPWAEFEATFAGLWDSYAAATAAGVVLTLTTGGDIRARCLTPAPWENGRFAADPACRNYVVNPTIAELKAEFREAAAWLERRRDKAPAGLLLLYSWSECDEGGNCLMPTYGDPDGEKIRAIGEALHERR